MNMSGDRRVSRTSARIAGVRRSRRSRRVIERVVEARVVVIGSWSHAVLAASKYFAIAPTRAGTV